MSTESVLREWRYGPVQAERLAAALLHVEGYSDVDPQHPLGGPDGLKDVLCRRGLRLYVAAAYFPNREPTWSELRSKFETDFQGVERNGADGMCFFVNQYITLSERSELRALSSDPDLIEIYHLERMRSLLDSPYGCGIRLEYLRLPMSDAEQFAFWSSSNFRISEQLARLETMQRELHAALLSSTASFIGRTNDMHRDLREHISSTLREIPGVTASPAYATSRLDVPTLCWIHRIILQDDGPYSYLGGTLRANQVWVGSLPSDAETFMPPPPEEVHGLLSAWAAEWRDSYEAVSRSSSDDKLLALTRMYYELLRIHPFADGNGRLAATILDQAARELLQRSVLDRLNDERLDFYRALQAADGGNLEPLRERIAATLS